MEIQLWTWSGTYFGYRDGDDLFDCNGRRVGRFHGKEIFGRDGRYLGELRKRDRLITDRTKLALMKDALKPRRHGPRNFGPLDPLALPADYRDFPKPEELP